MTNNSSAGNATWMTNSTVKGNEPFSADYIRFNYIMVGVSFGLLLIIIVIAKVLCIYNKEPYYDKVDLSNALRLKDDEMPQPTYVRSVTNGNNLDYGPSHVPGEISDEDDPDETQNGSYHKPERSGSNVWHTPTLAPPHGGHPQQRSVVPSRSLSSDTVRHSPAPSAVTSRASSGVSPLTERSADPETEAGRLLRHLEAMMDDEYDRRSPVGAIVASSRCRQSVKRYAWPFCEVLRSAPIGDSVHYLVDIT